MKHGEPLSRCFTFAYTQPPLRHKVGWEAVTTSEYAMKTNNSQVQTLMDSGSFRISQWQTPWGTTFRWATSMTHSGQWETTRIESRNPTTGTATGVDLRSGESYVPYSHLPFPRSH